MIEPDIILPGPDPLTVTAELTLAPSLPAAGAGMVRVHAEWDEGVTSLVISADIAEAIGAPVWRIRRCVSDAGPTDVKEVGPLECVIADRRTTCTALVHGDCVRFGLVVLTGTGFVADRTRGVLVPRDTDGWFSRIGRMVPAEPAPLPKPSPPCGGRL